MSHPLTDRQAEVLAYLRAFFAENDQLPPVARVAGHFGFSSNNAAHDHFAALVKKGEIERNAVGGYRFVRKPQETQHA